MKINDIYFGTSEDLFHLQQTLRKRLPMSAYMNPDYDWKLKTMLLSGKQPEAFRDRRHVVMHGTPDFITKAITTDRRQYTRHEVATGLEFVMIDGDAKLSPVAVQDISYGGLAFVCERELSVSVGSRVGVSIKPGKHAAPEDYRFFIGTIMNVREKDRKLIVGLEFLEEHIDTFAQEVDRIIDHKEELGVTNDHRYHTAAA